LPFLSPSKKKKIRHASRGAGTSSFVKGKRGEKGEKENSRLIQKNIETEGKALIVQGGDPLNKCQAATFKGGGKTEGSTDSEGVLHQHIKPDKGKRNVKPKTSHPSSKRGGKRW